MMDEDFFQITILSCDIKIKYSYPAANAKNAFIKRHSINIFY